MPRFLQFSLRSIFCLTALVAVLCVAVPPLTRSGWIEISVDHVGSINRFAFVIFISAGTGVGWTMGQTSGERSINRLRGFLVGLLFWLAFQLVLPSLVVAR